MELNWIYSASQQSLEYNRNEKAFKTKNNNTHTTPYILSDCDV